MKVREKKIEVKVEKMKTKKRSLVRKVTVCRGTRQETLVVDTTLLTKPERKEVRTVSGVSQLRTFASDLVVPGVSESCRRVILKVNRGKICVIKSTPTV